ncbi:hypothetical protein BGZ73_009217 [Actinomortierella ambigua]|nr:hypothetical protein BGZ73_009217 [Actinomortierella ambigua]
MEPEYSKKSDMYSFGMVLWAMAANSNIPFSHVKNDTEASKLIMEGQRCEIPKETPPEFRSWIERCWQHLPKERPTTGELLKEMADAYPQLTTHKSPLTNDAVSIPNVNIESVKHALKPTSPMAFDSPLPDKPFSDTTMPHHSGSSSESRVAMSAAAATSDRNSQSDKDFSSLMERARNHDVDALMSLALLYETGDGVLASESSAVFFYGRAAEQGHAPALFYLAGWFQNGHGSISQDKTRALKYYQAAAGKGHPEAQATLGHLYLKGSDTVTPDYALALDWFRKAASNEHADAAFNVGRMIANGQGADRDDVMAYICYRIAAQKGHADAMFALGEMCRHRQGVIQDKDGDIGWFRLAAEQGHPLAREEVDKMSKTSQAIQLSDTGASSHRSSPHVSDVPMAADEDPSFYESIGVSSGNGLAWDLLQKDDSDDPEAQFMIGKLLEEAAEKFQEDSRDKKQRYSEAFKWYHKAAEQGHADAQRTVARMYKEGRGVRKDDDEVMIWLTSAADGGDMKAQVELGSMYWFGQIVAQNDKVAASWLRKAAEQGDADAQWMLSMMNRTDGALKRDGEQIVE